MKTGKRMGIDVCVPALQAMSSILRIFPHKNSYTPEQGADVHGCVEYGLPKLDLLIPEHDEIHVNCVFTWDKAECEELAYQWEGRTNKPVKLGGPAYGSPAEDFIQGMYIKPNIVFTTRGCNNQCPWCGVPGLEGKLKELPVCQGNIIQDNNFLQASKAHKDKVFDMLRTQKGIHFQGGLEAGLIDDYFCDALQSLYYTRGTKKYSRVEKLWLACDTDAHLPMLKKACERLKKAGFNRNKIYCYVLSYGRDRDADEARARAVYEAGAMPFMQLYRDFTDTKTEYDKDWDDYTRMWMRPAAIIAHMEKGTDYRDF